MTFPDHDDSLDCWCDPTLELVNADGGFNPLVIHKEATQSQIDSYQRVRDYIDYIHGHKPWDETLGKHYEDVHYEPLRNEQMRQIFSHQTFFYMREMNKFEKFLKKIHLIEPYWWIKNHIPRRKK